jgi:hypothetical protein
MAGLAASRCLAAEVADASENRKALGRAATDTVRMRLNTSIPPSQLAPSRCAAVFNRVEASTCEESSFSGPPLPRLRSG